MIHNGAKPVTKILKEEEYLRELHHKLNEEVNEYLESEEKEEIADILEVLYAILDVKGITKEDVEKIRIEKVKKRGAFQNRIFLERED